jgi:hypothetical protein
MEHTYEELKKKTVAQLREIAKELKDDSLRGYTQLHKAELLPALCKALGVPTHEQHEVVGLNKSQIKAQIRKLKVDRQAALEAHDRKQLKSIRREIRNLKRRIRKAAVV